MISDRLSELKRLRQTDFPENFIGEMARTAPSPGWPPIYRSLGYARCHGCLCRGAGIQIPPRAIDRAAARRNPSRRRRGNLDALAPDSDDFDDNVVLQPRRFIQLNQVLDHTWQNHAQFFKARCTGIEPERSLDSVHHTFASGSYATRTTISFSAIRNLVRCRANLYHAGWRDAIGAPARVPGLADRRRQQIILAQAKDFARSSVSREG